MSFFRWLSLRQLLTVPYVVLVLALTLALGTLSYRAGRNAVDTLSEQLLSETVGRIAQAVEKHVFGSSAVLELAFPQGVPAPSDLSAALPDLRTRFWLATSVHRELNNYAYYGDVGGHFFGLWRESGDQAQLRLRLDGTGPRTLWRLQGIHGVPTDPVPEQKVFEPRERPWYRAAADARTETWTSIYIDFRTSELVATRARRVMNAQGGLGGVVATDVSLQHLNSFVRSLPLSRNGIAFVVEPDGNLIATSRGDYLSAGQDGRPVRLNATDSLDALLAASHREVLALIARGDVSEQTHSTLMTGPDQQSVQLAYARIQDSAGLDWFIVVAVPRQDFLGGVTKSAVQTLLLGLLAAVAVVLVGLLAVRVMSRDLRHLTQVARQIGEGQFDTPLNIRRRDEIGELAGSILTMRERLATDRLTGLASREHMIRRIEDRLVRQQRRGDDTAFALLFLDVNGFKLVNDQHGHAIGDKVLAELGQRMQGTLRDGDLVARWSGDEFVILLDRLVAGDAAQQVVDKLHAALAAPLACLPTEPATQVSVAIGLARCPEDGRDLASLLKAADQRMYRDKQRQR
jgi:diguanylate cyclase (GGDEF)-like protein